MINKRGEVLSQDCLAGYNHRIYTFALAYLKNEQEAEAVVIKVFDQLLNIRLIPEKAADLDQYIFTVTRDNVLSFLKQQYSNGINGRL